jgi:RNA polymerase sigma-70 factor (ECF subfamily)
MRTTTYNPNEANVPPARLPRRKSSTIAASKAENSLGSQLLSLPNSHDGKCAYGHYDFSDDDLIDAAQHGDQTAFVELCRRHSPVAKRKIFNIVRNQEDAEDALQDTLLRAYSHLTSFRRSCKFSTWLTAIGVNSALMIMRKRRARGETNASSVDLDTGAVKLYEPVDRSPGPEGIYLKQQAILLVRREVDKLRPSLRSLVNHYHDSDCSLKETAIVQGISLAAAKSRLMRGRIALRSSLAKYGISKSRGGIHGIDE